MKATIHKRFFTMIATLTTMIVVGCASPNSTETFDTTNTPQIDNSYNTPGGTPTVEDSVTPTSPTYDSAEQYEGNYSRKIIVPTVPPSEIGAPWPGMEAFPNKDQQEVNGYNVLKVWLLKHAGEFAPLRETLSGEYVHKYMFDKNSEENWNLRTRVGRCPYLPIYVWDNKPAVITKDGRVLLLINDDTVHKDSGWKDYYRVDFDSSFENPSRIVWSSDGNPKEHLRRVAAVDRKGSAYTGANCGVGELAPPRAVVPYVGQ